MSSRVRWHELARRPVLGDGGKRIGHVVDVVASPVDDRMTVVALLVGRRAWWGRIVQSRWFKPPGRPVEIAWDDIVELGDEIRTGVRREDVRHRRAGRQKGSQR